LPSHLAIRWEKEKERRKGIGIEKKRNKALF
jgi:hypothetical protein